MIGFQEIVVIILIIGFATTTKIPFDICHTKLPFTYHNTMMDMCFDVEFMECFELEQFNYKLSKSGLNQTITIIPNHGPIHDSCCEYHAMYTEHWLKKPSYCQNY